MVTNVDITYLESSIFLDITPCSEVKVNQNVRGTCATIIWVAVLAKQEATSQQSVVTSSEMSVDIHWSV
jgi:hypothetical protein